MSYTAVMPTEFTSPDGLTITLDDTAVRDLKALSTLTREPEHALIADAVERLRQAMIPSTKQAVAKAARKSKDAK